METCVKSYCGLLVVVQWRQPCGGIDTVGLAPVSLTFKSPTSNAESAGIN